MFSRAISAIPKFEAQPWVRHYVLARKVQIAVDASITACSFMVAHVLRFDGWPPGIEARRMWLILPYVVLGRIAANSLAGIYKRVWRYASIPDVGQLAWAACTVSGLLLALRIIFAEVEPYLTVPIGIILIDYLLVVSGMSGVRIFRRVTYESATKAKIRAPGRRQRVLMVGAGDAGIMAVREISRRRDLGIGICGFVDDDKSKLRTVIHGVPVLGSTMDLPGLIRTKHIDQVIITMASSPRKTIRRILDVCESVGVPVRIIPGLYEILGNRVTVSNLRSVEIEDLLGRDTIDVAAWLEASRQAYLNKRVMVTGGGGSIGRELCRQLAVLEPAEIILLDKDENSVFEVEREVVAAVGRQAIKVSPVVCDLRIAPRLNRVFSRYRPHVVFHAAAHKHVPLMEGDASEAVLNNINGTAKLLQRCAQYQVERCVMVSTDKAVNPSSVMGATKRVAELMFQAQAVRLNASCHYSCVRFGNVLGSRGSVIPIFREQIRNGGPVTVTHPEMVRYFMTMAEAAQLIIQAGVLGQKGEIFLLDMGEPVSVLDLAKDMIRLSGLALGEDIDIEITGPRPGEKLMEQLLIAEEGAQTTRFEKIFVAPPLQYDFARLDYWVEQLTQAAYSGDDRAIFRIFQGMGIGFRSLHLEPINKGILPSAAHRLNGRLLQPVD